MTTIITINVLYVLVNAMKLEKEVWTEMEAKLSLFVDDMTACLKEPKRIYWKLSTWREFQEGR